MQGTVTTEMQRQAMYL